MFRTLQQLENSCFPEHYKALLRPHFQHEIPQGRANKYHNKHVYLCKRCDTMLEIIDLKTHQFRCIKCGPVTGYIFFSSKKEAAYYTQLQIMKNAGVVTSFKRQVPYNVNLKTGTVKYVLDFLVEYASGDVKYIDVKGKRLPHYVTKKKLIEDHFNIIITEV